MKFSHIADVHLGNWRDPTLKELGIQGFIESINISIQEQVDFILLSGDLFHTALPGIDYIKIVIRKLKELKQKNIRVYYIAGSHDYSPTGKTMLDLIEEADLGINVMKGHVENEEINLKFTKDPTGAKITGVIGRAGNLERTYYEKLNKKKLEEETGFKIFLFHTALDELKPKDLQEMESTPITFLPKNFDYYAGGHVHIVERYNSKEYKNVIYPGPIFPGNFQELQKLTKGGFYIYDNGELIRKDIELKKVLYKELDLNNLTTEQANNKIKELEQENVEDKIVLIRAKGTIKGKTTEIKFNETIKKIYENEAYTVLKNTTKLKSQDFKQIKINANTQELEEKLIKEHIGQTKNEFINEEQTTKQLIKALSLEKHEGEKTKEYEERIKNESLEIIYNSTDDI